MKLKNKFSWSHSRRRNFESCKRRYYLNHYAFWGGWEEGADEFTRLCYRLSKVQSLDMWGGQIVHEEIESILDHIKAGGKPEFPAVQKRAVNALRSGWVKSKNKAWKRSPKCVLPAVCVAGLSAGCVADLSILIMANSPADII